MTSIVLHPEICNTTFFYFSFAHWSTQSLTVWYQSWESCGFWIQVAFVGEVEHLGGDFKALQHGEELVALGDVEAVVEAGCG